MSIITVLSSPGVRTIMGIHGNVGVGWWVEEGVMW